MLEAGVITAIGVIWILSRMNLRRVAGYALIVDVGVTTLLTFLFIGTYAGMMTGMLAGVIVSAFLSLVKRTAGAERLKLIRTEGEMTPKLRWKEVR